jgi:NCS1 family nucleobase:cation symporter-1
VRVSCAVVRVSCAKGIAVTGATAILYGKPLWQPSELFDHFPTVWRIVANLVMVFSVLAMNITANLVSPANDFSNINPDLINFKMGGYITGVAGLLIFPWKLFSDANDFIFIWLIGYSAVLGAIAGVRAQWRISACRGPKSRCGVLVVS